MNETTYSELLERIRNDEPLITLIKEYGYDLFIRAINEAVQWERRPENVIVTKDGMLRDDAIAVHAVPGCKPLGHNKWAMRFPESIQSCHKGLLTHYVYVSQLGDCSNGGVTSRKKELQVLLDPLQAEEHDDDTLVIIAYDPLHKQQIPWYHAVPLGLLRSGVHSMFGGNMVQTSDSRKPCQYAIPVHDRVEQ